MTMSRRDFIGRGSAAAVAALFVHAPTAVSGKDGGIGMGAAVTAKDYGIAVPEPPQPTRSNIAMTSGGFYDPIYINRHEYTALLTEDLADYTPPPGEAVSHVADCDGSCVYSNMSYCYPFSLLPDNFE